MVSQSDIHFESLLEHLKEQRAFDFTGYKRASLMRRVQRRMDELGIDDFENYSDHLLMHPEEFAALFNTILINVTGFFRDPETWSILQERVLPGLVARRQGQPLRAWSAGCASGEEAYSLAMVFCEVLGTEEFRQRVKIYATDVDEEALAFARQGAYTGRHVQGMPRRLLDRYFEVDGQRHVFRKELRRCVIFGRNDLVQDAPISHVDVLACRNTLMYFNAETQAQVLRRLHFALNPDGVLFLGKAELLLGHSHLFRPLELKERLFAKLPSASRDRRLLLQQPGGDAARTTTQEASWLQRAAFMSSGSAQIVVDTEQRLAFANVAAVTSFGLAERDLGRALADLELSYRPVELRSHLQEVAKDRRAVWVRGVTWSPSPAEELWLDVQLVPLVDEAGRLIGTTVLFHDITQARQLQTDLEYSNRQLATAYEELQSTNEELQTTNEELQSTIEELETTNEELQSTNEELETMNAELQSINDELHESNVALSGERSEVGRLNRFLAAVLSGMTAGVAVVDPDLRVLAWNAMAEDLWGLRSDEAAGEHLLNLDIGLPVERLKVPLRRQLVGDDTGHDVVDLEAVNRRGRPVRVRVTVSPLSFDGAGSPEGAILLMEVVQGAGVGAVSDSALPPRARRRRSNGASDEAPTPWRAPPAAE